MHKQNKFKCDKCNYSTSTISKLNTHKKDHTEDELNFESIFEPVSPQTIGNPVKRGLSVSPEVANCQNKSASNNSTNKKVRN